jgi:hypothetical protein
MKRLLLPTALALALLAPLATASADPNSYSFCTTGLSLNFCGSVEVTATPNAAGGTDVTFQVVNTSSGSSLGGTTFTGWEIGAGTVGDGSGRTVNVSAISPTSGSARENSLLSQCSASNARIYTCAGTAAVTISFLVVLAGETSATSVYVNAAAENGAAVTVAPEPATLALVATGLLGLGGPISRWRRRRDTRAARES